MRDLVDEGCCVKRPGEGLATAGGIVTGAGAAGIAIDMLVTEEVNRAPRNADRRER